MHLWGDARLSEICLSDLIDLEFVGAKDIITFKLINISNIYHREHSLYLEGVAVHRCSSKQVFVKVSQYSQESTCVGVSF